MNVEVERVCKNTVVAYNKVLSRHASTRTEEKKPTNNQYSRCPDRDPNRVPPEYESKYSDGFVFLIYYLYYNNIQITI
jgi:hypothetical protein